jgi:hypothetical protein
MRALRDFLLVPPGTASLDAPAGGRARVRPARAAMRSVAVPGAVAVLCAAEDAGAVGVATASVLARRARAACAVACVWTAPPAERDPPGGARAALSRDGDTRPRGARAARRTAAALAARDLHARACGRAVAVALDADPAAALADARRALAAAGDAPTVVVLGGPRPAAFDELLVDRDRIVVLTRPGADAGLAALAAAGLPDAAPVPAVASVALGPAARALAAAGLVVPAALRRALDPRGEVAP